MCIAGEWLTCDDEATCPVITALVIGPDGQSHDEAFLVDSGSDRTVFIAALLERDRLTTISTPPGFTLADIATG